MKRKLTIIDTSCGNILSIKRAAEKNDCEVLVTKDINKILSSDKLILPGVGAFKNAMDELKKIKFLDIIENIKDKEIPTLGICLGMQLLFDKSEEFGNFEGLGLIKGKIIKLSNLSGSEKKLKIPSIGWNEVKINKDNINTFNKIFLNDYTDGSKFYFIHSYYASVENKKNVIATYKFGDIEIPSIVSEKNIIGCQFHPEKSGENGLKLIKNFISI